MAEPMKTEDAAEASDQLSELRAPSLSGRAMMAKWQAYVIERIIHDANTDSD